MPQITLLLAHATPQIRPRYEAALGRDVRLVPWIAPALPGSPGGGLSSRYVDMAVRMRRGSAQTPGPLLDPFLAYLGLDPGEDHGALVAGGYSAGYAWIRELVRAPSDRERIAGWLLLDGGHAPLEADGSPADAGPTGVAWLADLCREAAAGRTVLCYGCSDVDPVSYASTSKTIMEALRLADLALPATREPCAGCRLGSTVVMATGALRVEAHDHRIDPVQEHADALTSWGPALAARAVAMVRDRQKPAGDLLENTPTKQVAGPGFANDSAREFCSRTSGQTGLGERALAVALRELGAGVRETSPNRGPRVDVYNAALGLVGQPWCASFVAWCDRQADGVGPGGREAAVWRLIANAREAGAFHSPAEYSPLPGDLACFGRDGQDPRRPGQKGHVGRVETAREADGYFYSIEGNSGDRLERVIRNVAEVVGFVRYPRAPEHHVATEDLAAGAAAVGLDRSTREILEGK